MDVSRRGKVNELYWQTSSSALIGSKSVSDALANLHATRSRDHLLSEVREVMENKTLIVASDSRGRKGVCDYVAFSGHRSLREVDRYVLFWKCLSFAYRLGKRLHHLDR
jgi:hypothetical protein